MNVPPEDRNGSGDLPQRYTLRAADEEKLICCRESPNIVVSIRKGLSVPLASALKYGPGTIFLDGVVDGGPFIDSEKKIYNLDHHNQCVRLFTLSACEQAYVLIRSGLDLGDREWMILANEPDLDTVLAIWLLMNHARVSSADGELRRELVPLVRLEGVIDVHGFELLEFAGLPERELADARTRLADLLERETELKEAGLWSQVDLAEFTLELLQKIDQTVYPPGQFEGFEVVDELARVTLEGSHVAVVVRADLGIYETEEQLRRVHEKRLGVIALLKDPNGYTLRQVKPFLSRNLEPVYALLNLMDPAVAGGNRWGGSDVIGGSPRRTGTRLAPEDIAWAIERAFHRASAGQALIQIASAVVVLVASLLGAWALSRLGPAARQLFAAGLFTFSLVSLVIFSKPYPRLYGMKLPVGKAWVCFLALAAAGGVLGGTWNPVLLAGENSWLSFSLSLILVLALPCAAEILFRGAIHGLLAETLPTQASVGKWFLSWPVAGSALIYAGVSYLPVISSQIAARCDFWVAPQINLGPFPVVGLLGALLFGLAAGMARERSESLLAPVVLHWLTIGILALSCSRLGI